MRGLKFRIAKFESKNVKFEVILEAEFGCRNGEEVTDRSTYENARRKN